MMQFSEIQASWPLLETLQLLPFAAALVLWHVRGKPAAVIGLVAATLEMLLAVQLYQQFDLSSDSMQFANQANILGLSYHVAVDGISILFVLLTSLLSLLGVLFIIFRQLHRTGVLAIMALIQALLMSQFVTVDLLWFVLMSIVEMIALGYLLYRWATFIDAKPMVVLYSQFMTVSVLLMLIGTFMLGWNYSGHHQGNWSFDLYELAATPIEPAITTFTFFALFYGLAIRIPLFPLHGWLPITIQQGNLAVAPMFLLGLKVGVFGLLRFVFPIMPESVIEWRELVIVFAVIGIFYAALLAMRQGNLRRLMAYAVISHTGILMIGLFTLTEEGFAGGIMLAINFGLAISGLMVMIGLVWQRTKTASIQRLGGIFQYMPIVSLAFLISGLAVAGMPATPGFDAVHLLLEAAITEFGSLVTIAAALGNVVAAGFLLFAFQKAFLAEPSGNTSQWDTRPTQFTERAMAIIMIVVILAMGFFSELWLSLFDHSLNHLSAIYQQLLGNQGGH